MFSLPWRKKKIAIKEEVVKKNLDVTWLEQYLPIKEELPRPNWEAVHNYVDDHLSEEDQDHLWAEIAREWMRLLMQSFSDDYKTTLLSR